MTYSILLPFCCSNEYMNTPINNNSYVKGPPTKAPPIMELTYITFRPLDVQMNMKGKSERRGQP